MGTVSHFKLALIESLGQRSVQIPEHVQSIGIYSVLIRHTSLPLGKIPERNQTIWALLISWQVGNLRIWDMQDVPGPLHSALKNADGRRFDL